MVFRKAQGLRSISLTHCREEIAKLEAKVLQLQEHNLALQGELAQSSHAEAEALRLQLQRQKQSFGVEDSSIKKRVEDLQKEVDVRTEQKQQLCQDKADMMLKHKEALS